MGLQNVPLREVVIEFEENGEAKTLHLLKNLLDISAAVIGIMLICLHTGFRPSRCMFPLMGMVASRGATLEEIMPILRERERQCARDQASCLKRDVKKRAAKFVLLNLQKKSPSLASSQTCNSPDSTARRARMSSMFDMRQLFIERY